MNLLTSFSDYISEIDFDNRAGGDDMDEFDELLCACRSAVERFVMFRLSSAFDADDVLQEVYLSAYHGFSKLRDKANFKAWLIGIARNKCNDFYRDRTRQMEMPIDVVRENILSHGRMGVTETTTVRDTLNLLADKDKRILWLYYFEDMPQAEIAKQLGVPIGTVKSRLHMAKQRFRAKYPYPPQLKGAAMKKLPDTMPAYKIERSDKPPFSVVCEELIGWFMVPKLGEKLAWAMYEMPGRGQTEYNELEAVGKAEVHGIEGVELTVKTFNPMECNAEGGQSSVARRFIAQLTDTHCRYLAESHMRDGVKRFYTFLDGDAFLGNWGFGENNCGNETHITAKGDIQRSGHIITSSDKPFLLDIVGRYTVTIDGQKYDTVCVMDIDTYNLGVTSEQYLDQNGRTVLWRRFNRDDWAYAHYKQKWSALLPESERLSVNGDTYVHWYDCITDYIMA